MQIQPKIVVVGSANVDYTMYVQRLPHAGETILGGRLEIALGGKGANQAIAACRAGAKVSFVANVGDDSDGERCLSAYRAESIDVDRVVALKGVPTGVASILTDQEGSNMIAVASGANALLTAESVMEASEKFEGAGALILQNEVSVRANAAAARLARNCGSKVILNAAPAQKVDPEMAELIDILIVNEHEASEISGKPVRNPDEALGVALALASRFPMALITLGSEGVAYAANGESSHLPAFSVNAVDAVGAGDTFTGYFAMQWCQSGNLAEAVRWASAAAALSVTIHGAVPSIPHDQQVEEFLRARIGS